MAWLLSPTGIGVIVILIVAIASLIYWKRKPIAKWLARTRISKVQVGPVEVSLDEKKKPTKSAKARAGVSFGEGSDFTGASVRGVAGRDIRRGTAAAAKSSGGQTPGVDFGKKTTLRDAEIEDVAGRDVVED